MAAWKTLFRRIRTLLWTALAIITVLAATVVGIGELLLPYSDRYQPRLESWLTREFGRPATLESFSGEWKAFGPRIQLQGLRLGGEGSGEDAIAIQEAQLDVRPISLLWPRQPLYSFSVVGADLVASRQADGRWTVSGLGVSGRDPDSEGGSGLGSLLRLGEVSLLNSSLRVVDPQNGLNLSFSGVDGRLQLDGLEMAAEIEAQMLGASGVVAAELEATVTLTLDDDERPEQAQWHAKVRELLVAHLRDQVPWHPMVPERGRVSTEVWGNWSRGGSVHLEGVADVRDTVLALTGGPLQATRGNALFRWDYRGYRDWELHLDDITVEQPGGRWEVPRFSVDRRINDNLGLWLSADQVPADPAMRITRTLVGHQGIPWPDNAPRRVSGVISDLDLVLDGNFVVQMVRGKLSDGRITDWDRWPDVDGVNAEAELLHGQGSARIHDSELRALWPRQFTQPLTLNVAECFLDFQWGGRRDWRVTTRDCPVRHELAELEGTARFAMNEGRPFLDLNIRVPRADISRLDPYWPRALMGEAVVDWMNTGLQGGTVRDGRISLVGDLDDWPFASGEGQLSAHLPVMGGNLLYADDWPPAEGIDAVVVFDNAAMRVSGSIGSIGGARVPQATAAIPNLSEPVLGVDWSGNHELDELLGFLRAAPLGVELDDTLAELQVSGAGRLRGRLQVGLGSARAPLAVSGTLQLGDNVLQHDPSGVAITGVTGLVSYHHEGFAASRLDAMWGGSPVQLDLSGGVADENRFAARMTGRLTADQLIPQSWSAQGPWLDHASGVADWETILTVRPEDAEQRPGTWLSVVSSLRGMQLAWPEPLQKSGSEALPVQLLMPLGQTNGVGELTLGDRAGATWVLRPATDAVPLQLERAGIRLGDADVALPLDREVVVSGSADVLDLDGFIGWVRSGQSLAEGGAQAIPVRADLQAQTLEFLDREYPDVALSGTLAERQLEATFSSRMMEGILRYDPGEDSAGRLVAEFERLELPRPVEQGIQADIDPSGLPPLHLYARELNYLGLDLGETRVEAYPTANGLHFESIRGDSSEVNFRARGDWNRVSDGNDGAGSESRFDVHITSESLGTLLQSLDISSALEGGQTDVHFDVAWPGSPAAFALARLDGLMEVSIVAGQLTNAQPGAGRLLGLLSIQALPRRLALDFSDVFAGGFEFDLASGSLEFREGVAATEGFVMQSPAATITLTGSTDLLAREFNYEVVVRPGVGQMLPVLGAVAAGPGGAAAGLALQGLLQRQLGEAAQARYALSGPWDDPQVERLEDDAAQTGDGASVAANE